MNFVSKKVVCFAWAAAAFAMPMLAPAATAEATLGKDFHGVQSKLNDTLLDIYSGEIEKNLPGQISASFSVLRPYIEGYETSAAGKILDQPLPEKFSPAAQVGMARARLEHIAALAMLQCQKAGNLNGAQQWRALITLPHFANGVDSAMLLQNPEVARKPEVAQALAKEY